jgi:hypothetical protein
MQFVLVQGQLQHTSGSAYLSGQIGQIICQPR